MSAALVHLSAIGQASGEQVQSLQLRAPRANALEPDLLQALHQALDQVEAAGADKVLIQGGHNFSSGGDIGRFLAAAAAGEAAEYAGAVVPLLQDLILRMLSMPVLIAVAARGAVTGGAAGMVFAADLAVLAPDSFVQPYYGEMGFAPDGGWTAVLPERIGTGAALDWLVSNRRLDANALQALNLAHSVHGNPEARALSLLTQTETGAALAAKRLIWDRARLDVMRARLDAETEAFEDLITRPATAARMQNFLSSKE